MARIVKSVSLREEDWVQLSWEEREGRGFSRTFRMLLFAFRGDLRALRFKELVGLWNMISERKREVKAEIERREKEEEKQCRLEVEKVLNQ